MDNMITLIRTPQGWLAQFAGPHAAEIQELFGTTTIPTAFTARADSFDVQNDIAKRNPGVTVKVELASR